MTTTLRVLELELRTDRGWQQPYRLDKHVVIIHGPVDRGKTSFLNSIAFVFGRNVRFRGTVNKHLREVRAKIRIGETTYVLSRHHRRRSHIVVTEAAGTVVGRFPVRRSENQPTLSDWLLCELGLDEVVGSIYVPGGQPLDFASAILPYCLLCQDDIDRFLIMPPGQDTVRTAIMRLLFHLTSPEIERAEGRLRDGEKELRRNRDRLQVIEDFVAAAQGRTQQEIEMDIAALTTAQQRAAALLADLQGDANASERLDRQLAEKIRTAHQEWREAETELDKLRRRFDRAQREVNGYQAALDELLELQQRPPSPLMLHEPLANCPICQGPVPRQPPVHGHCYLCGGLHPGVVQEAELAAVRQALQDAQNAAKDLQPTVIEAEEKARNAELKVSGLRHERQQATGPDVHPHLGAIRLASAEHARLAAELHAKRNDLARIQPLTQLRQQITDLRSRQQQRQTELDELRAAHVGPDDLLQHLRGTLQDILFRIDLPHFTGRVSINRDTLLPLIDGLDFDGRGGGARSAVSIAYSLALLAITQEGTGSLLPTLLMIDSPRKNFGASIADTQLANRIYDGLLNYVITWSESSIGVRDTSFQIIIADNDRARHKRTVPKRLAPYLAYIDLTDGLITGLLNPHAGLGKEEEADEKTGAATAVPDANHGDDTRDQSPSQPRLADLGTPPDSDNRLF